MVWCKRKIKKKSCKELTVTYLKELFYYTQSSYAAACGRFGQERARKDGNPCNNEPMREEYKPTWDDAKPGAVFKSSHSSNNSLSSKHFYREAHHFYSPSTCLTTERAATALQEWPKPTETSKWVYSLFAKSCNVRKVTLMFARYTLGKNTWFQFIQKKNNFSPPKTSLSPNIYSKLVPLYKINLTLFLIAEFSTGNDKHLSSKLSSSSCCDTLCKHRWEAGS